MSHAHRHFSWAPRLVPATVASLVSLFAIAPAETAINRLLHAPHPHVATTQETDETPQIVLRTHHGPHENPAMRLQRYAYKPHQPQDEATNGACAEPCFDPNDFEPASGGVSGNEHGAGPSAPGGGGAPTHHGHRFDPPSSPSQEAQFDIAGIGEFAHGGSGGGSTGGGGGGSGGGGQGGAGSSGRDGGDDTSFVLLPGAGAPGSEVTPGGGDGGAEDNPPTSRREDRGPAGGGGSGGSPGFSGNGGGGAGGTTGEGGDGDEQEIETISLRVAPAAAPAEVSAPATVTLFAAALALLAYRRRTY